MKFHGVKFPCLVYPFLLGSKSDTFVRLASSFHNVWFARTEGDSKLQGKSFKLEVHGGEEI